MTDKNTTEKNFSGYNNLTLKDWQAVFQTYYNSLPHGANGRFTRLLKEYEEKLAADRMMMYLIELVQEIDYLIGCQRHKQKPAYTAVEWTDAEKKLFADQNVHMFLHGRRFSKSIGDYRALIRLLKSTDKLSVREKCTLGSTYYDELTRFIASKMINTNN